MSKINSDVLATTIVLGIKRAIDGPLVRNRFEALEQRIAALEQKPHVKFCGVWRAGTAYAPGDAATHQGGLWICKAPTAGEPSKDFAGWQLAVKSGGAR